VASVSSQNKAGKFEFINEYGSALGVRYLCAWLEVSPQGFYDWRDRSESNRSIENRWLTTQIKRIFRENHGNYGCPRIYDALLLEGIHVNYKRVERIMREEGLVGKAARLYRRKAVPEPFYMKHPNRRLEQKEPTSVNQQLAGDITYLRVRGEWRYLAVVMDLYSRRIIGWSLGKKKNAELTRSALLKAIKSRRLSKGLIFHTDRGSEYGAHLIQNELEKHGIRSSMNRPEAMNDNVFVESFFRTLKTESYHGIEFKDEDELRKILVYYLDDYYNSKRIHTGINSLSPVQYEKLAA